MVNEQIYAAIRERLPEIKMYCFESDPAKVRKFHDDIARDLADAVCRIPGLTTREEMAKLAESCVSPMSAGDWTHGHDVARHQIAEAIRGVTPCGQ